VGQDLATRQSALAVELHWASQQVFDVISTWAGEVDNAAVAVSMATTSRHLSWHVADLDELMTKTEADEEIRIEPAAAGDGSEVEPVPLHPEVSAALHTIRATPGTLERLAIGHRVLLPRLAVECVILERTAKPDEDTDPVVEIASALLGDLRRDRDDGEVLLTRLIGDVATALRVGEQVVDAERRIVACGGLAPITLT
jgi:hypothetical protein